MVKKNTQFIWTEVKSSNLSKEYNQILLDSVKYREICNWKQISEVLGGLVSSKECCKTKAN